MKKIGHSLFSCIVLVAFMGLSTPAFAEVHDPDCEKYGPPPQGPFEVVEFAVDTPDSHVAHAVSGMRFSGLACGSSIEDGAVGDLLDFPGRETLSDRAVIANPPGVEINPTVGPGSQLADGEYVGRAQIDSMSWYYRSGSRNIAWMIEGETAAPIIMRVDDLAGTDCEPYATACYKGVQNGWVIDGHFWVWVEDFGGGRTQTTIGPFHNETFPAAPAGLTEIDSFALCNYAGTRTGTSCGSSSRPFVQKNGDASSPAVSYKKTNGTTVVNQPACAGGQAPQDERPKGIYTVTVVNKSDQPTAPVTDCVVWNLGSVGPATPSAP